MKSFIVLLSSLILLFTACEEVPPAIDFSQPVIPLKDTTYIVSPPPVAQHKAVLIEDITGVRCINCPSAAKKAEDIVNQKTADSVIVIAQYPIDIVKNFTTPYPGVPQLACELSKEIVEALGAPQGLPSGYVDRKIFSGRTVRSIDPSEWINFVNIRLQEKTPVNIKLAQTISNRTLTLEVQLQYNTTVTSGHDHKYALYLIESNIKSTQLTPDSGAYVNYIHNHANRRSIGLAMGNPLQGPYEAGKTYLKQFKYEIPAEYVIAECRIVCMVLDTTTEEVINVREIKL